MDRTPVKSSNIRSVGYDEGSKTLEVEFSSGSVYQYHDVDAEKHKALMGADSIGKHFSAHIKAGHKFSRPDSG